MKLAYEVVHSGKCSSGLPGCPTNARPPRGPPLGIGVAPDQALDVAVEDQPDVLAALRLSTGRAGVAADDVVGGDEIQRRGEVQLAAAAATRAREVERRLVVEAGGAVVEAVEVVL